MITIFSPVVKTLARVLAFSRSINRRNLESWWYGEAMMHATELAAAFDFAVVVPQMSVEYFKKNEDPPSDAEDEDGLPVEEEGSDDGEDLEEADLLDKDALDRHILNQLVQQSEDNSSSGSTHSRITQKEAMTLGAQITKDEYDPIFDLSFMTDSTPPTKLRIPDFGIILVKSVDLPRDHRLFRRQQGVEIKASLIAVLIENKRHPSRSLKGPALLKKVYDRLALAEGDLMEQAVVLFSGHKDVHAVRCISMSGPYWRHAEITRDMAFKSAEYEKLCPDEPQVLDKGAARPTWGRVLIWGSSASDIQRDQLREEIEKKYKTL